MSQSREAFSDQMSPWPMEQAEEEVNNFPNREEYEEYAHEPYENWNSYPVESFQEGERTKDMPKKIFFLKILDS